MLCFQPMWLVNFLSIFSYLRRLHNKNFEGMTNYTEHLMWFRPRHVHHHQPITLTTLVIIKGFAAWYLVLCDKSRNRGRQTNLYTSSLPGCLQFCLQGSTNARVVLPQPTKTTFIIMTNQFLMPHQTRSLFSASQLTHYSKLKVTRKKQ